MYTHDCSWLHTPSLLICVLPDPLDGTLLVCRTICSYVSSQGHIQVHLWVHPEGTSGLLFIALTSMCSCRLQSTCWSTPPNALDGTLPANFSSMLGIPVLQSKTLPTIFGSKLPRRLLHAESRDLLNCKRQAPGGVRLVVGGWQHMVSKLMTLVDLIVWTLSLAWLLLHDLIMPHSHGVANCSPGFCRKARHFNPGESRSLTRIVRQNLLPASNQFCPSVCEFCLGLLVMITMVMLMEMVMVLMMVNVPKVLSQVHWLTTWKLTQTLSLRLANASRNTQFQISPKIAMETPLLLICGSQAQLRNGLTSRLSTGLSCMLLSRLSSGSPLGSQSGSQAGSQEATQECFQLVF